LFPWPFFTSKALQVAEYPLQLFAKFFFLFLADILGVFLVENEQQVDCIAL
jgi:hypothetical protein